MELIEVTPENSVIPVFVEKLTKAEQTAKDKDLAQAEAQRLAKIEIENAKLIARQSALAKLAELGLTEEEINAL